MAGRTQPGVFEKLLKGPDPRGTRRTARTFKVVETNALGHMREIAFMSRGSGDPALDFKNGIVHVMDPFLAFYLEHGPWIK